MIEVLSRNARRIGWALALVPLAWLGACTSEVGDPPGTSQNTAGVPGAGSGASASGGGASNMAGRGGASPAAGVPPIGGSSPQCGAGTTACGSSCCSAQQVCDQGACKALAQGCSGGLTACSGTCVDTASTAAHCGSCERACPMGQVCAAGMCACASGRASCNGTCVDLMSDAANCGTCGTACSGGRSCQQGTCSCPAGQSYCGNTCVDTQSSAMNCGSCGMACAAGTTCMQGQCVCGPGRMQCGTACADVQTDPANCGACGTACSLGQSCVAGACTGGGGGTPGADGCMGLATNVSISQIAVYQTVKIPIMQMGNAVAAASRNADVVTGRDALFRVFASVGQGWTARQLSARVYIQNASTVEMFHAKVNLAGNSMEGDLMTTFQVNVPKGKLTKDSTYAVELVECGAAAAGTVQSPRFPAMDGAPLGARDTGPLKIRIIPLQANSMTPDTSEMGLQPYKALLLALFPVSDVQITVGDPLTISNATDWAGNLDRVRQRRQMDAPAADIYYYGLLKPTNTLRDFCGGGCTTGIGYVPQGSGGNQASQRVAMGIGFSDNTSAETLAHEVAHNHGRNHAPCGNGIAGVDGNFPYNGGQVGVYGFDARTQRLIAPDRTDLMGYCQNKWLSDYTYDALVNRVATVNGATATYTPPELVREWNVLLLDGDGPRWGASIDVPEPAAGEPEPAEILDAKGNVIAIDTVYRTEISDIGAFSIEVPKPRPGWHSVRVIGSVPLAY